MQINGDEVLSESPYDIKNPIFLPIYVIKVELANKLINILEVFNGEVLKTWIFSSFTVDLYEDMALEKFLKFNHIQESVILPPRRLFYHLPNANIVEMIVTFVSSTWRNSWVCTIIHVIWHIF